MVWKVLVIFFFDSSTSSYVLPQAILFLLSRCTCWHQFHLWHHVTCLWVLELIQPPTLLPPCPSCLKWFRTCPSHAAFTKMLIKKEESLLKHTNTPCFLYGRSFGLCYRRAVCTISEMIETVLSSMLFVGKNFQDDLHSLWTTPLLKERKAEVTRGQDAVDFSGLGSGATFLGKKPCCRLPLERPTSQKHSADVNGEGQVSCLQPTDNIRGNLNIQVPSEIASENLPLVGYRFLIFLVLIPIPHPLPQIHFYKGAASALLLFYVCFSVCMYYLHLEWGAVLKIK